VANIVVVKAAQSGVLPFVQPIDFVLMPGANIGFGSVTAAD
jgi:hypothetical protein